ncbi:hypothetical protein F5884DRAFT_32493 [Xylogone sp. PMI_703]|nr:hypothetical protein F5884DRAFT_32493 [Xylogone sp. PMI_703]
MSAGIPESIPTSQDPRSKRPLKKKRALSPTSEQAQQVEALFAKPDREIAIPSGSVIKKSHVSAPPEIVANVQGSSAGAGSGEFHVYKAARRREYERLRAMDEDVRKEKEQEEFEREKKEREEKDAERTRKNREKREKKNKKKKGGAKNQNLENGGSNDAAISGADTKDGVSDKKDNGAAENGQTTSTEEVGVIIHDDD